jgi:hypothetical protein
VQCASCCALVSIINRCKSWSTLWTMKSDQGDVSVLVGCWNRPGTTSVYTTEKMADGPCKSRFPKFNFKGLINALTWSNAFWGERGKHYNKTRLLQPGFSTSTSEKTRTLLLWKTTSRFRQTGKYGCSHVRQDVSNGHVPNGSEVWGAPRTLLHKVMSYFTTSHQYR